MHARLLFPWLHGHIGHGPHDLPSLLHALRLPLMLLLSLLLPLALALIMALLLGGCSISKPELPKFTTTLSVPLGARRLSVANLLEDHSFLTVGADSSLAFAVSGDPDTLDVFPDLGLDLAGARVKAAIGGFALDASDPAEFAFTLGGIYPAAQLLDGQSRPVPPFTFDLAGAPADLPDVQSAVVKSGRLEVSVTNGLPVPVAGPADPERVTIALTDPRTGAAVVTVVLDAPIPAGATVVAAADLAGVTLPDSLGLRLQGGSSGSAAPVTVVAQAPLGIAARLQQVRVRSAVATIGPQSFTEDTRLAMPDSLAVIDAEIASGSLPLAVRNGLAIPCRAVLTLPEIRDAQGEPIATAFDLGPGESAERTLDLAGTRAAAASEGGGGGARFGSGTATGAGASLDSLTVTAAVTSPGSAGAAVALAESDSLEATVATAHLRLGAVTGTLPRRA